MGYKARYVEDGCYIIDDDDYGDAMCRIDFLLGFREAMIDTGLMTEDDLQNIADEFAEILVEKLNKERE